MSLNEPSKAKSYTMEDVLEETLYLTGFIIMFLGFSGIMMIVLFPKFYNDNILSTGMTFLNSYMIAMGVLLVLYHNKIIVRYHRTAY